MMRAGLFVCALFGVFGCGTCGDGVDAGELDLGDAELEVDANDSGVDADLECPCPEGMPCCDDACGFRDATHVCDRMLSAPVIRTRCVIEGCGGAFQVETRARLCAGDSAACDGELTWQEPLKLCPFVPPCIGGPVSCSPERRCQPLDETSDVESLIEDALCPLDAACS